MESRETIHYPPPNITKTILEAVIRDNAQCEDKLVWGRTTNGLFTIKSAYNHVADSCHPLLDPKKERTLPTFGLL